MHPVPIPSDDYKSLHDQVCKDARARVAAVVAPLSDTLAKELNQALAPVTGNQLGMIVNEAVGAMIKTITTNAELHAERVAVIALGATLAEAVSRGITGARA